jgi:uncharacterized protein
MERAMDAIDLGLFLSAAFVGGIVSGVAGFAMGFIVSGVWLHVITPVQTAALIVGYGLWTQSYGVWKLRGALRWRTIAPFAVGGLLGIPLGTVLLSYLNPLFLRAGVAVLLLIYSIYGLAKPTFTPRKAGPLSDGIIGFFNGLLGGLTGLPGFIITIWCQMRGWSKDEQRAVFQPVILTAMIAIGVALSVTGGIAKETLELYAIGLPFVLAGLWIGFRLYGRLDDAAFRRVVLIFLLCSGMALLAAQGWTLIWPGISNV